MAGPLKVEPLKDHLTWVRTMAMDIGLGVALILWVSPTGSIYVAPASTPWPAMDQDQPPDVPWIETPL